LTDNLAEMGTAKQSGSHGGFDASKALDGNINQDWNGHSCGHTAVGQKTAWWRLDIGQPANVCTRNSSYLLFRNSSKLCMLLYYHM
jgi:hypothetical protein